MGRSIGDAVRGMLNEAVAVAVFRATDIDGLRLGWKRLHVEALECVKHV